MVTYPSTHGVFEEAIREICEIVHEQRRSGLPGRRQHERPGGALPAGRLRRRRLSSEPAQDVLHPARRRRSRHGADLRRARTSRRSCPATRCSGGGGNGDRAGVRRGLGEREHPADLLDLHRDDGRRRAAPRHRARDPERQLHGGAAPRRLPGALPRRKRAGGARVHPRPPAVQGERRESRPKTWPSG